MFLAKMASVEAKPKAGPHGIDPGPGVFEVRPGCEIDYLHPLPVRRLWGVGPATHERLDRLGVSTIGDLAAVSPVALRGVVGPGRGDPPARAGERASTSAASTRRGPSSR